jgi:YfiH family protein
MPPASKRKSLKKSRRPAQSARTRGDGWSIRRSAGMRLLAAKSLAELRWLVHGFSTRTGGFSALEKQQVLNLGFTDWDARDAVTRNRDLFLRALGGKDSSLVTLHQIHSDLPRVVAGPTNGSPCRGDALITAQPGFLLGVQTADCVPILLADTEHRCVAAIHAGWRGTLARIAAKTLGRMRAEFGTRPQLVVAALGPAIGRCCYEVGPEVAQAFAGQFAEAVEWFDGPFARLALGEQPNPLPWLTMMPPGHEPPPECVWLDLRAANRWQLIDAGVKAERISVSPLCTACRTDLLFSYRREGKRTGRLMAAIAIRGGKAR